MTVRSEDAARYEIAQLNVGRALGPLDGPVMADFMNWLDEINALAERNPGFVWRLHGESGNNTELKVSDDPLFIVNLSVWSSVEALYDFTYRSDHKTVFKRRHDWFERFGRPNTVLWWQPTGTVPTAEEALARLELLTTLGPTPDAFSFKERFGPPGRHAGADPTDHAQGVGAA
jgi:hypothetical protein